MRLEVPEEVLGHARGGIRQTSQTFMTAVRRTWPTLWALCAQLATEQKEAGDRVSRDISCYTEIRHLQILHGMAGTAVRRELGRHFACRFSMPDHHTITATAIGDSESPPSTRIANIVERDFPLGAARLSRLAARAKESADGFTTDSGDSISGKEMLDLLRIHATEPYRKALEVILGVQLAFHAPRVSAARCRGTQSVLYEAFVSIEEAILHASLHHKTD